MRKILSLFLVTTLLIGSLHAQVMVQGISHPTAQQSSPTKAKPQLRADKSFTFDDIKFWVGSGSNQAAMVIEWHDGKTPDALVWGYRWNGEASGHDMIVAIAKADPRLVLLTQQTGWMGYTIDGIGYSEQTLHITYDLEGARTEPKNAFKYEPPITNPLLGQTGFPSNPASDVANAIREGLSTGVIYHPINAQLYGYPSYDYDYWKCNTAGGHWKAGWYSGYWSYFIKDSQAGTLSYSDKGSTSRQLTNGSWDAWSWNGDMETSSGAILGDHFIAAPKPVDPDPDPEPSVIPVSGITLTPGSFSMQPGSEAILTASVSPGNAADRSVSWRSSNPAIASVHGGAVTALKPGTTTITATTTDGGYTANCKITVMEEVVPDVSVSGSAATISFPKVKETTTYEIRLYKYKDGNTIALVTTYVADINGKIIHEIKASGLRASSDLVSITLTNLEASSGYIAQIQAMKGLETIATYYTEQFVTSSGTVNSEDAVSDSRQAFYINCMLHLRNLEGYQFHLIALNGQVKESFRVSSSSELYPVAQSSGVYILAGEKNNDKISFKIQIIN